MNHGNCRRAGFSQDTEHCLQNRPPCPVCPTRYDWQHLPWRTRLAIATCYAFEDAEKVEAAAKCAAHATEKVGPPIRRGEWTVLRGHSPFTR